MKRKIYEIWAHQPNGKEYKLDGRELLTEESAEEVLKIMNGNPLAVCYFTMRRKGENSS